jgi:hypothetical protein
MDTNTMLQRIPPELRIALAASFARVQSDGCLYEPFDWGVRADPHRSMEHTDSLQVMRGLGTLQVSYVPKHGNRISIRFHSAEEVRQAEQMTRRYLGEMQDGEVNGCSG